MTDEEYVRTMDVVAGVGAVLVTLGEDLDTCRRTVESAHALGPILYPGEYRDGVDRLRDQQAVLDAAISFRDACRTVGEQAVRS